MTDGTTLQQLARVLGMLGSNYDGEVLNAARLAERLRLNLGKSWPEIFGAARYDATMAAKVEEARAKAAAAEARAKVAEHMAQEAEGVTRSLTAERDAAAARARDLEASTLGLADLVSKLRAELAALKLPSAPERPRPVEPQPPPQTTDAGSQSPRQSKPSPLERLVERLRLAWCDDEDIMRIMGWPSLPGGFRRSLEPIAKNHGFWLNIRVRDTALSSVREYHFERQNGR